MNPITFIYTEVLFRPLLNLLVAITEFLPNHSLGLAIVLVTIAVRLILFPSALNQARATRKNQAKMSDVQVKIKQLKEQHKDDKQKQAQATMEAYREAGINPAAGCLPLLIQLPILLALYRVFLTGIGPDVADKLYSFVSLPLQLNQVFLGFDLTQPSLVLGVIAGVLQFILMKFLTPTPTPATPNADDNSAAMMASMQKNMMYIFPVMTIFIALQLPAALAIYWVTATALAILQQLVIRRLLGTAGTPVF